MICADKNLRVEDIFKGLNLICKGVLFMKVLEHKLNNDKTVFFERNTHRSELLFFDIETTGFSAMNTVLYMIGCMYFKYGTWNVIQWFNDDDSSELDILEHFSEFASGFRTIISYNGEGFDIPYLEKKFELHGMENMFSGIKSIDVFKNIKPLKKVLGLPNMKLKTIEDYLGIGRGDIYSGGELINVYDRFLVTGDLQLMHLLVLHNLEDIKNMLYSTDIMLVKSFFEGEYDLTSAKQEGDEIVIHFSCSLPKILNIKKHDIILQAGLTEGTFRIPIFHGIKKVYFENYRDYYYLPIEDYAIHKSVAAYMDSRYRKRATKDTCYQKVNGDFVPAMKYPTDKLFGDTVDKPKKYMELSKMANNDFDVDLYVELIMKDFYNYSLQL